MKPLVVLQSSPPPLPTTNPYNVMLCRGLEADPAIDLRYFSWRTALLTRYDVFHAHWPEILIDGRTPLRRLARQGLALGFFLRLAASRAAVVRTVHNIELPQGISRREVSLLRLFDRITTLRILINDVTELAPDLPSATIPMGDYREWYAGIPHAEVVPGRVAYVGTVRRYKSVDQLLDAFAEDDDPGLSLTIGGRATSEEQALLVQRAAAADDRISCTLRFLSDEELVEQVTEAELVVMPYRQMHNSSAVLAALSLDRPVLVPDNEVNSRLAAEIGQRWLPRFSGALRAAHLRDAIRSAPRDGRPDLSARGWHRGVTAHVAAYRRAVQLRRGSPAP